MEHSILEELGTVPLKIGTFLLVHSTATLGEIQAATALPPDVLASGLSLMIQRRVVEFFIFEKTCRYSIARDVLLRRVYFPLYLRVVSETFSPAHLACFTTVLLTGVHRDDGCSKPLDELVAAGVLRIEAAERKAKQIRTSSRLVVADFDALDRMVLREEIEKYVKKRGRSGLVDIRTLKMHRLTVLIRDPAMRRIFNMILDRPETEDKDITVRSLLGVNRVKAALLSLQRLGLVVQRCIGDYSIGSRIEHSCSVDEKYACLSMVKRIERAMSQRPKGGVSDVWISDWLSLATDRLILSLGS